MAAGQPRQQDGAVGAHLQKGHRPAQRDVGRLRGGRHCLGLDRRDTQVLGRHFVSAAPHAAQRALQLVAEKRAACRAADGARAHATRWPGAGRSRTQRRALGHRLRQQRHHGDARSFLTALQQNPLRTLFTPRSNARACSPSTTGCTTPSGRKRG